jgi:hypothetical protein
VNFVEVQRLLDRAFASEWSTASQTDRAVLAAALGVLDTRRRQSEVVFRVGNKNVSTRVVESDIPGFLQLRPVGSGPRKLALTVAAGTAATALLATAALGTGPSGGDNSPVAAGNAPTSPTLGTRPTTTTTDSQAEGVGSGAPRNSGVGALPPKAPDDLGSSGAALGAVDQPAASPPAGGTTGSGSLAAAQSPQGSTVNAPGNRGAVSVDAVGPDAEVSVPPSLPSFAVAAPIVALAAPVPSPSAAAAWIAPSVAAPWITATEPALPTEQSTVPGDSAPAAASVAPTFSATTASSAAATRMPVPVEPAAPAGGVAADEPGADPAVVAGPTETRGDDCDDANLGSSGDDDAKGDPMTDGPADSSVAQGPSAERPSGG